MIEGSFNDMKVNFSTIILVDKNESSRRLLTAIKPCANNEYQLNEKEWSMMKDN